MSRVNTNLWSERDFSSAMCWTKGPVTFPCWLSVYNLWIVHRLEMLPERLPHSQVFCHYMSTLLLEKLHRRNSKRKIMEARSWNLIKRYCWYAWMVFRTVGARIQGLLKNFSLTKAFELLAITKQLDGIFPSTSTSTANDNWIDYYVFYNFGDCLTWQSPHPPFLREWYVNLHKFEKLPALHITIMRVMLK